jgi:D-alanyl-D-alanine carboxypeptidase
MRRRIVASIALALVTTQPAAAQTAAGNGPPPYAAKIAEVMARPDLKHATFGVSVYDLDAKRTLYELNAEQLFTPGSTTKLLTTGTALGLLGADYRFHTPVYRTGPVVDGATMSSTF